MHIHVATILGIVLDTSDTEKKVLGIKPNSFFMVSNITIKRAFNYAPRPLINRAPRNDAISLTTYTTHTHATI